MTLLHVTVASPDDALLALSHGADGVHVPAGAATPDTVRAIVAAAQGRRVSAAAKPDLSAATALHDAGAGTIEVALGPGDADRVRTLAALAPGARLIGAIGTDRFDPALIQTLPDSGFAGVTLDAGQGVRLFDRTDIGALAGVADEVRASRLAFGLSGALEPPDIPRLLLLAPDTLRLDRRPMRAGTIDALRALIPSGQAPARDDELDVRRKSSRRDEPVDRVFVRDFVLPMHIGVYAREHGKTQDVRFDVDVRVLRQSQAPADMRDIFSYDIITDSIRMIAAREHVALVEGLAETIAARLLTYPRVASVTVKVEKLDTGPGGVGVEITRERPAEAATVLTLPRSGEAST
ncbi:MAG: (5-formylfuran-3-yl)methyl phosphate synthase [Hyphomicrobiales bacterium]|nr:(5-formylfuran-3-yl)methyl phosphate synthase [Hyphomicrobiales bacterium]